MKISNFLLKKVTFVVYIFTIILLFSLRGDFNFDQVDRKRPTIIVISCHSDENLHLSF